MAVLLGAAPLSHAQIYFSNGVVPFYGARFSYASPYLGTPLYGASAYGAYGYGYGTYGYGPYAYGAGLPGYRFGVLPRHAGLARSLFNLRSLLIFTPTTTTTTPTPTTVDGSTIKVRSVDKGPDWTTQIAEAKKWKDELFGTSTKPVMPSDKGLANLSADDRAALAEASTRTAVRLRNKAGAKVQDVVPQVFFAEAIQASVPARKAAEGLIRNFYTKQAWNDGDSLDEADRRSTLAKFFDDLAQALKQ
jgi:hypothetical protein